MELPRAQYSSSNAADDMISDDVLYVVRKTFCDIVSPNMVTKYILYITRHALLTFIITWQ